MEKFRQMIELQGGDSRVVDDAMHLPKAKHTLQVMSPRAGFISSMQCEQIGTACVMLGGGRERKEDSVDPAVGVVLHKKVGDQVNENEPLATIHYNSDARGERARQLIAESIQVQDAAPLKRPLIHRVIQKSGDKH